MFKWVLYNIIFSLSTVYVMSIFLFLSLQFFDDDTSWIMVTTKTVPVQLIALVFRRFYFS